MIWLYVASLVFGGVFVLPMMLGALDFDGDVGDLDFDLDVDVDVDFDAGGIEAGDGMDLDVGGDAPGFTGAVGDFVSSLLNFRSIVLGLTFFGLTGVVLSTLDSSAVLTLVTAIVLALVAAAANSTLTTFVLNRQQSSHVTMREVAGMSAEVMLPIAANRRGRVRAQIAGQTEYFTALPHKPDHSFEPGETVVVIEIVDGLAKVASLRELGP